VDDYSTLSVCTTHVTLVGTYLDKDHRCGCDPGDEGWREREWAGYDVPALIELCYVCVRDVMGSGTRWSWRACKTCRGVNNAIATAINGKDHPGNQVVPLGRHSIMNSITIRSDELGEAGVAGQFVDSLMSFFEASIRIMDWRREEGLRLIDVAGFANRNLVSLDEWTAVNPGSRGASTDALCRLIGAGDLPDLPGLDDLRADRNAFLKRSQR
jgi:hypothetical protein